MHRITGSNFAPGNLFRDGDPQTATPATSFNAAWCNAVQEEIAGVVEGAGAALNAGNNAQLLAAIQSMISAAIDPPGAIKAFGGAVAPAGWAICDRSERPRTDPLFLVIGTSYGPGNGVDTYNLPDGRGRGFIGAGQGSIAEQFTHLVIDTAVNSVAVATNDDKWITGMLVQFDVITGAAPTTNPASLLDDNDQVYIVRLDATHVGFATTRENAQNGVLIDITAQGNGAFSITHTLKNRVIGQAGGEEDHAQSLTELLKHRHSATVVAGISGIQAGGSYTNSPTVTGYTGGDAAMNNMSPYFTGNWIIKL